MAKSIYLTDEQYKQITEAARKSGFRVQRGRGSQLALFIVAAANTACTGRVGILRLSGSFLPRSFIHFTGIIHAHQAQVTQTVRRHAEKE